VTYDVIILGGGLAGLSAAVELCARGYKILLLEQRPRLGGRTYSFVDETTGDIVDNGQHLLMGCYHETRSYLEQIGSGHLATLQPHLRIDFLRPNKPAASLSCPPLPAPFHILGGLIGLSTVSLADRLKLLRVGLALQRTSAEKERRLDSLTVDEWLETLGQSAENRKYLWDVIAIGSLNDSPQSVSALLFFRVLRAAFLGKRENSSLLVPRAGLSELLVDPAARFIESHGGEIKLRSGATKLEKDGGRIKAVRCEDGSSYQADFFISAVPHTAVSGLLESESLSHIRYFSSSPIITINLWLDREILDKDFTAVLDSRIQWIFNRTALLSRKSSHAHQYLSIVISAATDFIEKGGNHLVQIAVDDLRTILPEASRAHVVHSLIIKEKRATFTPKPGLESQRPSPRSEFENLFLAGDWTATGYPATIEGAVMSGKRAAGLVLE
jgi:squalene-associated FAD-dependent desaturase